MKVYLSFLLFQAKLPCPLENNEINTVSIQWQKDRFGLGFDPKLPEYSRFKCQPSEDSLDLVISDLQISDTGTYECTIYTGENGNKLKFSL